MSLVADYSSSSSSSSSDAEDKSNYNKVKEMFNRNNRRNNTLQRQQLPLPSANLLLSKEKPGEVFNNPYKEAENAKIALLERHVKMVNTEEHLKEKNGKKLCWNYRKGRCRFGSNCSFAHDSDLQSSLSSFSSLSIPTSTTTTALGQMADNNKEITTNDIPLKVTISKPQSGLQIGTCNLNNKSSILLVGSHSSNSSSCSNSSGTSNTKQNRNHDDTTDNINNKSSAIICCTATISNNNHNNNSNIYNKRRSGLGDSIVPSKKVMKQYNILKKK